MSGARCRRFMIWVIRGWVTWPRQGSSDWFDGSWPAVRSPRAT